MARKRYKPEEIVNLLRQAEVLHGQGLSMADAIRQLGISEVTFYRWRKEYAGMSGDQLRRLKELEKENERLRRAVSDLTLDKQISQRGRRGKLLGPSRRRQCIDHVCDRLGVSERPRLPGAGAASLYPAPHPAPAATTRTAWSRT